MRKEKISEIVGSISTKYVDEAVLYTGKTKKLRYSVLKWGAAAACLCLALVAAIAVPKLIAADETVASAGVPDYPAMIMIDDKVYKDSGKMLGLIDIAGYDGQIISTCSEVPTENNQSNFGIGNAYIHGSNNTIYVQFEDGWYIFVPYETGDTFSADKLSEQDKMALDPGYNAD